MNIPQAGIFDVDWDTLKSRFNHFSTHSRFSEWMKSSGAQNSVYSAHKEALANLTFPEQVEAIETMVAEEIANVLKIPGGQIERTCRINALGIDSLIAVRT